MGKITAEQLIHDGTVLDDATKLIDHLVYLQVSGRSREAVFFVTRSLDRMLSAQEFEAVSRALAIATIKLDQLTPSCAGALLSITAVASAHLGDERVQLYNRVHDWYVSLYGPDKTRRLINKLR